MAPVGRAGAEVDEQEADGPEGVVVAPTRVRSVVMAVALVMSIRAGVGGRRWRLDWLDQRCVPLHRLRPCLVLAYLAGQPSRSGHVSV